ncbi:MAG: hypothetical protein GTN82_43055 [Candidatus Aminicenantes bacterium]|nr:hypothetical protein [Candidatus Aminicenantes bacterium]NIN23558.1 hypothetical protein [Candidatus Aminicenantes bacterium]NIR12229.1 hypothetical protein [Candidatus Aminicenantes bacterium]
MKKFFPAYISHIIQLLNKYQEFAASKNPEHIVVIPIIKERIKKLQRRFFQIQSRDDLTAPDQFKRNIRSFQTLLMEVEELECFGLPILTHYQKDFDGYLTYVLNQLCDEIGCPVEKPHVCAISTGTSGQGRDYYWYHRYFDTIFVPAAEKFSILNLPDLLHELGHHILKTYRQSFFEPFSGWFSNYNEMLEKTLLLRDIRDSDRIVKSQKIFSEFWPSYWSEELVCDLIAVYCVGLAYAWTNLKICQSYHPDYESINIYYYAYHPPDSYRMDAILAMLKHLGIDCLDVENTWFEYAEIYRHNKQALYDNYFPVDLIEKAVPHIFQICDEIGLVICHDNIKKNDTIIYKLNNAWSLIRRDPKDFQKLMEKPLI